MFVREVHVLSNKEINTQDDHLKFDFYIPLFDSIKGTLNELNTIFKEHEEKYDSTSSYATSHSKKLVHVEE